MLTTRSAILLLLLERDPEFGAGIIKAAKNRSLGRIRLKQGAVYPALRALEKEKLVRSKEDAAPRQGRPKRFYALTAKGEREAKLDRQALLNFFNGLGESR